MICAFQACAITVYAACSVCRSEAPMATFKDTRMLATGADNSAKISASLSFGCITARQVWAALDDAGNPEATLEGRKALHMHMQIR